MKYAEDQIQKAVAAHLKLHGTLGVVWWHTPNEAYLGGKHNKHGRAIQGARLKSFGLRPGVSDIVAMHDGKFYCLELKAPGNTATEAQLTFIADMEAAGAFCAVAVGIDRALACLTQWGLLRGKIQ